MTSPDGGSGRSRIAGKLKEYLLLIRFHRPIGTLLLLWPTLWALWIASSGRPDPGILAVFLAGVFLMRSAGCAINDYADREVDPHVERTRSRPLAAGRIAPTEALLVAATLALIAFLLVLLLNPLTVKLAIAGGFLAVSYPFLKRYTSLPQLYLGVAFGWSVPMAFAAQNGAVPGIAWLIFASVICWAGAYDTMYAMVDRKDDLRIGVRSTAILFGKADRLIIGLLQAATVAILVVVGGLAELGFWYQAGLFVAVLLALWQQYLIRDRAPDACFQAFLNNNLFGLAIFCGILLTYLLDF
jgi:4-hydroxybenzoate polyprenyltransferase